MAWLEISKTVLPSKSQSLLKRAKSSLTEKSRFYNFVVRQNHL